VLATSFYRRKDNEKVDIISSLVCNYIVTEVKLMKLSDVKKILDDHSYTYTQMLVTSSLEFYQSKGFRPSYDKGAFVLLSIPNPNHKIDIQLIFNDASEDPDFSDLEFGGVWYELYDCEEDEIPQVLFTEIQRIINGSTYFIFACTVKKGIHWKWDGVYYDLPDAEMNNMDAFRKTVGKIKSPKKWWKRFASKTDVYEIYNWTSYEKIIK